MADDKNLAALTAAIARLRELQLEDLRDATFIGWKPESVAAHERREGELTELQRQLASLDETTP